MPAKFAHVLRRFAIDGRPLKSFVAPGCHPMRPFHSASTSSADPGWSGKQLPATAAQFVENRRRAAYDPRTWETVFSQNRGTRL